MRIALRFSIGFVATSLLALAGTALAQAGRYYDPPSRVARLAHAEGSVSFSPAGTSDWRRAQRNRPHTRGDRLWTDRRSRAELQLGGAAIRLDERTGIEILELDDRNTQIELSEGTLNLGVRHIERGMSYEIATPMFALVVDRRANVRIDVEPRSGRTEVVVWDGTATAYAERGRFALHEGDAVRFFDETLRDYDFFDPRPDGFDAYVDARDARLERSGSLRYVPASLIGYDELDAYGSWRATPDYGSVWFPSRVGNNWRPYRDGHWIHQEPWGWTWIDDAEWGFATSHYGRWAQVDRRWGWIPSPRRERPVYAPALVGFVGSFGAGSRQPIGWFPLGPREVYMPSYRTSRDYFTRVNYGNTTFQDRSWIDGAYRAYDGGRGYATDYRYRNQNDIVSVPRDVFMNARPVARAAVAYRGDTSAAAQLDRIRDLAPVSASRYGAGATATSAPQGEVFEREVFARHAPSASAPPEAAPRGRERDAGHGHDNVRVIRGEGLPVIARDAPRTEGSEAEHDRGSDHAADRALDRRADPGDRGEGRAAERALERRADPDAGRGDPRDDQRDVEQAQREAERAQREAERAQREGARAQDERQRERDNQVREHEQAQREAERLQREQERAQQQAEQQGLEQQRAQQEAERQLREQQQAQRQAEQHAQQEAERAAGEQQRAQQQAEREAEQQAREQQQAQEQAQRDAEQQLRQQQQAQEQAQREAERQVREQQQAQEQAQREAERAAREQQQAQEQAQREAEQAAREQQRAEAQAQAEAQQAAEQAQRDAEQAAREAEKEAEREERRRAKEEGEGGGAASSA